jgi:hypothetical protein
LICRSRLAGEKVTAVFLNNRSEAIASKPAPTEGRVWTGYLQVLAQRYHLLGSANHSFG